MVLAAAAKQLSIAAARRSLHGPLWRTRLSGPNGGAKNPIPVPRTKLARPIAARSKGAIINADAQPLRAPNVKPTRVLDS